MCPLVVSNYLFKKKKKITEEYWAALRIAWRTRDAGLENRQAQRKARWQKHDPMLATTQHLSLLTEGMGKVGSWARELSTPLVLSISSSRGIILHGCT